MTPTSDHPWPATARRLQAGDVQVDLRYRRVLRDGEEVELPQRMFDLLLVLLAEPHVLHTRTELFRRVWSGVIVEDANLSQSVWMLRKALGPARKDWIRTVAKSGYVFEPPTPVELVVDPASPLEPGEAALSMHAATRPLPSAWWRQRRGRLAGAAVLGVALLGAGLGFRARQVAPPVAVAGHPVAIALIELRDPALAADQRWPTTLLRAWLQWKLSALPEVTLLSEAHLAAGADELAPTLILLSAGRAQDDPDQIYVRARFPGPPGSEHQIELHGSASETPELIDELSRQVMAQVLPTRKGERWPALRIDAATARAFAGAFEAFDRRDWPVAINATQAVVQRAPEFGLAHQQLAVAQSRLGQIRSARTHMERARTLLRPLPADADAVLDAQQLGLDPRRFREAARAYGELAAGYPHRTGFALDQAILLSRSGEPKQALVLLQAPAWERQPTGVRIQHLLAMTSAQLALNDPEHARASARKAETLAAAAGDGWAMERAQALMNQAQADVAQRPERADLGLFERAAKQFELAGSPINALLARYQATSVRAPSEAGPQLDALLARTREAGYRSMEVSLLQHAAFRHYMKGEHPAFRRRLEQALAIAQDADDPQLQDVLEFHLLNEDLLRGDFASADRRVAWLQAHAREGAIAAGTALLGSVLSFARGDFDAALVALDRSQEQAKAPAGAEPILVARLACNRGEVLLQQGELSRARAEFTRCGARDHSSVQPLATIDLATVDLLAGDRERGLQRLGQAQGRVEAMADGPDRWMLAMQIAFVRTRFGETEQPLRVYRHVLPRASAAGYRLLESWTHAGLAEIAAMQGDWDASRRHATSARDALPEQEWLMRSRLDQLEIAASLARGERERAGSLAAELDADAHRLGDVIGQVEVHDLMTAHGLQGDCSPAQRNALVARTGMRGAGLDWLGLPPTTRESPQLAELAAQ